MKLVISNPSWVDNFLISIMANIIEPTSPTSIIFLNNKQKLLLKVTSRDQLHFLRTFISTQVVILIMNSSGILFAHQRTVSFHKREVSCIQQSQKNGGRWTNSSSHSIWTQQESKVPGGDGSAIMLKIKHLGIKRQLTKIWLQTSVSIVDHCSTSIYGNMLITWTTKTWDLNI